MSGNKGSERKRLTRAARIAVVAGALAATLLAGATAATAASDSPSPTCMKTSSNGVSLCVPAGAHPNGVRWQ